ncbi:flagellar hook-basal body complex protein [Posidoniimonas polymericola]|nr:flagellar hook-basal body complex protein [Posidoniimonas polymericola]
MTTALTGLQAAETTIDVVGNNVANSNTVAFKESNVIFATQFLQTQSIGSAPSTNGGGTNPRQIGLGVKVAEITPDFTQGTIEISSSPLDVAIQGDGFLMVQGGGDRYYTRNGQLKLNSSNEVVTTTGQRVLGYGVNDQYDIQTDNLTTLQIPLGAERVAQATESAVLQGVLNPAVPAGTSPQIIESMVLGNGAIEQPTLSSTITDPAVLAGEPSTASMVGASGAGVVGPADATEIYRFAFVDANGLESDISAAFTVAHGTPGNEIDLSDLPLPNSPWVSTAVYRDDGTGTFYQVGTTNTDTFTDDVSEAALTGGAVLDDTNIDAGNYGYFVTYYDPTSGGLETRPTAEITGESISEATGGRIRLDLNGIGTPTDSRFTQIRIYRNTSTDGSNFRLVDTVPAPGAGGFVDSYVDTADDAFLATQPELNLDGPNATNGTALTAIVTRNGDIYETPFQEGTLTFGGTKSGVDIAEQTFEVTSTTTISDLMLFMEGALGLDKTSDVGGADNGLPTPTADVALVDGKIEVTSNMGEENAISISQSAFTLLPTGSNVSSSVTLNFGTIQAANGPGTSTEMIVYDSLGLPLKVRVTTVLEESPTSEQGNSTRYRWYATSADNEATGSNTTVVGDGILTFDSEGDLIASSGDQRITLFRTQTASSSPLDIALDFSSVKSLGEVDAQGNPISTLNVSSQDGFPPGVMTDFVITEDGLIQGQFSNGTQRTVGQLMMARFTNNSGLQQVGDSLYSVGVNSGEPVIGKPGEEGIGTLTSGAVELSNTDIGQNLIELILASTQYRGGARVITAAQELLDELMALRR